MKIFEWIKQFENRIKESFNIKEEESMNVKGYDFPFPIGIELNEKQKNYLSLDKTFVIGNKKLWILYLNTPADYDAIGIKTDENTGKERVKKFRPILYKNNNHKEYLIITKIII